MYRRGRRGEPTDKADESYRVYNEPEHAAYTRFQGTGYSHQCTDYHHQDTGRHHKDGRKASLPQSAGSNRRLYGHHTATREH